MARVRSRCDGTQPDPRSSHGIALEMKAWWALTGRSRETARALHRWEQRVGWTRGAPSVACVVDTAWVGSSEGEPELAPGHVCGELS